MILSIPWLVIAVLLYNIIAFTSGGTPDGGTVAFEYEILKLGMISGATWTLKLGDLVLVVTLAILFVELLKATRTGESSIVDHALSMILFIICVVEMLTVTRAATSTFFLITVVTLIDVVAGFTITIRAARRDLALGGGQ